MSRMRPPLADTVGLLLPSHAETLLLRACLRPGDEGRLAWVEWARVVQHPRPHLTGAATGTKRLLPLLHHALRGNGADPGRDLSPYLRTIALRERHRAGHVDAVLRQAAEGFERRAIGAILLKGAALAHSAYPDPALRHCHDLDFLVEPARLAAATAALAAAGFAIDAAPPGEAHAIVDAGRFETAIEQRHEVLGGSVEGRYLILMVGNAEMSTSSRTMARQSTSSQSTWASNQ